MLVHFSVERHFDEALFELVIQPTLVEQRLRAAVFTQQLLDYFARDVRFFNFWP
jgi:hypothetical protein